MDSFELKAQGRFLRTLSLGGRTGLCHKAAPKHESTERGIGCEKMRAASPKRMAELISNDRKVWCMWPGSRPLAAPARAPRGGAAVGTEGEMPSVAPSDGMDEGGEDQDANANGEEMTQEVDGLDSAEDGELTDDNVADTDAE